MNKFNSLPTVDKSTPGFVRNPRADALFKEASRLKSIGSLTEAVEVLEAAEVAINEGKTDYGVQSRCKLPMHLQEAGKGEEAADKLVKLLCLYPPSWGKKLKRDRTGMFLRHLENQRAYVYDKLRLVLQREGKYEEAVPCAVLAETYSQRLDTRIYKYLAKKWNGKDRPEEPDLIEIKKAGGTFKDYEKASDALFEWHEFKDLTEQYEYITEAPELKSVKTLLKKLRKADVLPAVQDYAKALVRDFKKSDEKVISEVRTLLKKVVDPDKLEK